MPVIEDFEGLPEETGEGENAFERERDLLAMPALPWTALTASFFAVVLLACVAHAVLLATKEKNKLITQTLELKAAEKEDAAAAPPPDMDAVVLIPEGAFLMGRPEDDDTTNSDATPMHKRWVDAFYISKYEVTNAEYAEFVQAENYIPPMHWGGKTEPPEGTAQLPVTYVSSYNAEAYAKWRGARLCSEEEWEKAARGPDDDRIYPYGNEYKPELANVDYLVDHLTPVGAYPEGASPYGVDDMMGNVYEWTSSRYGPYPGNQDDPINYAAFMTDEDGNIMIDPDESSFYVVTRGGCWKCDPWSSQVTTRNPTRPDFASDFFGMRLCWNARPTDPTENAY